MNLPRGKFRSCVLWWGTIIQNLREQLQMDKEREKVPKMLKSLKKIIDAIYSYILASIFLLSLPILIIFVVTALMYFNGVETEKEHYDSRAEAVVFSCVETSPKGKVSSEDGVLSREWRVEAAYVVDGTRYITRQTGSGKQVGSTFTLSYNSENPSECIWISDFDEYMDWNKKLMIGSGAAILIAIFMFLNHFKGRKKNKQEKGISGEWVSGS